MSARRILVLSSTAPSFAHFRAAQTVLASILLELKRAGAEVSYAVAAAQPEADQETLSRLASDGVVPLDGSPPLLDDIDLPPGKIARTATYIREAIDWRMTSDRPRFREPAREANRLLAWKPDAAILFWDTWYEHLLPSLDARGLPVFGYLGRPPFAAGATFAEERLQGLRRVVGTARMAGLERRHIARMRRLRAARNICALDARWYDAQEVPCRYLSNTWPDAFGSSWREVRKAAEKKRGGIHLLGNIGGLNATGNRFGMRYLTDNVLPGLARRLAGTQWTVNICGRFELPAELSALREHPNVALRGFVTDIDDEVAGNHVFLLLNNAGPYTGGYTRVIYAFSSGACLVAHSRLAESMPELVHDENCLLGSTPEELVDLIARAAADPVLRARLGSAARLTYETRYQPAHVAAGLIEMLGEG